MSSASTGNDHVYWHDFALTLSEAAVAREIDAALATFQEIVGDVPRRICRARMAMRRGLAGRCSSAGPSPTSRARAAIGRIAPRVGDVEARLPEIPTTLPTVDELLGQGIDGERLVEIYERSARRRGARPSSPCTPRSRADRTRNSSIGLLERLSGRVRFRRLVDVARDLDVGALPVCEVVQGTRPGRAGTVSCQGRGRPGQKAPDRDSSLA